MSIGINENQLKKKSAKFLKSQETSDSINAYAVAAFIISYIELDERRKKQEEEIFKAFNEYPYYKFQKPFIEDFKKNIRAISDVELIEKGYYSFSWEFSYSAEKLKPIISKIIVLICINRGIRGLEHEELSELSDKLSKKLCFYVNEDVLDSAKQNIEKIYLNVMAKSEVEYNLKEYFTYLMDTALDKPEGSKGIKKIIGNDAQLFFPEFADVLEKKRINLDNAKTLSEKTKTFAPEVLLEVGGMLSDCLKAYSIEGEKEGIFELSEEIRERRRKFNEDPSIQGSESTLVYVPR